jgi:hypothetical protein
MIATRTEARRGSGSRLPEKHSLELTGKEPLS